MAINPLSIPSYGPALDITSDLARLTQTINEGQKRQALADLGKGLADGTINYREAAGKIAGFGDVGDTLKFLALAEAKDKQAKGLAASQQFNSNVGNIFGPNASSAAIGQPASAGPVVPNDSNAMPGQVGMDLRLADRTQDFIQDFPNASLSSGFRTRADQQRLYDNRASNPNPVARPGSSNHERGMAADIAGMTPEQRAMLPQYGLSQPVANDPPHVELAPQSGPVQVAQASGPQGLSIAHVPMLLDAIANPDLPAAQKDAAKLFLTRALDDAKTPDKIRVLQQLKADSGYQGSLLELEERLKAAGKTDIKIDNKAETAEAASAGKAAGERRAEMFSAANSAVPALSNLTRVKTLLDQVAQGKLEPSRMTISAWAKSMGVNDEFAKSIGLKPKDVGSAQAIQSLVNELVIGKLGPGGFPSNNFSDSDRQFITDIFPKLGNDPRANSLMLEAARRAQQAKIDRVLAYQTWADDPANKGKSFERFEFEQARALKRTDLFGDLREQAEALIGGGAPSSGGNAGGIKWRVVK